MDSCRGMPASAPRLSALCQTLPVGHLASAGRRGTKAQVSGFAGNKGGLTESIISAQLNPPNPTSLRSITCISRAAGGLTFLLFSFCSGLRCDFFFLTVN